MKSFIATSMDRMKDQGGTYIDYGLLGNQGARLSFYDDNRTGEVKVRIQDYNGENLTPQVITAKSPSELSDKLTQALGTDFNKTTFDSDIRWDNMTYFNKKSSFNQPARVFGKGYVDGQVEVAALEDGFANKFRKLSDEVFPDGYVVTSMVRSHDNNRLIGASPTSGS